MKKLEDFHNKKLNANLKNTKDRCAESKASILTTLIDVLKISKLKVGSSIWPN